MLYLCEVFFHFWWNYDHLSKSAFKIFKQKFIVKYCFCLEKNHQIVKFTELLKKMGDYSISRNYEVRNSTRLYLQRNLEKLNLLKFQTVSGCKYVDPSSMKIDDFFNIYVELQSKLEKQTKESINHVKAAAVLIWSEILKLQDTIPWPPQPEDLQTNKFKIPETLNELLSSIFNEFENENSRKSRIIYSLAQDIIYSVRNGKVKTPKSILLPTMVKTLTNNTEIISSLNRLGHGVSYSTLMESQTKNAYLLNEQQVSQECIIPKECRPEEFSIYVADNIDRNEERWMKKGETTGDLW